MIDGLYKVTFRTSLGEASGTIVIAGEEIRGGDSALYYRGSYQNDDGIIEARVSVRTHSAPAKWRSVFGAPSVELEMTGSRIDSQAVFACSIDGDSARTIEARMIHLTY